MREQGLLDAPAVNAKAGELEDLLNAHKWNSLHDKLVQDYHQLSRDEFNDVTKAWQRMNQQDRNSAGTTGLASVEIVNDNNQHVAGCDQVLIGASGGIFEAFETPEHRELEVAHQDMTSRTNEIALRQRFGNSINPDSPIFKDSILPWEQDSSPDREMTAIKSI